MLLFAFVLCFLLGFVCAFECVLVVMCLCVFPWWFIVCCCMGRFRICLCAVFACDVACVEFVVVFFLGGGCACECDGVLLLMRMCSVYDVLCDAG